MLDFEKVRVQDREVQVLYNPVTGRWRSEEQIRYLRDYLPDGSDILYRSPGQDYGWSFGSPEIAPATRPIALKSVWIFSCDIIDQSDILPFVSFVAENSLYVRFDSDEQIWMMGEQLPGVLQTYLNCDYPATADGMRSAYMAAQSVLPTCLKLARTGGGLFQSGDRL